MDFEWWENVPNNVLEFGYALVRTNYLSKRDDVHWPPTPEDNFRRCHFNVRMDNNENGHYNNDDDNNKFLFGLTKDINKSNIKFILESILSSVSSPDSNNECNECVIVGYNIHTTIKKLKQVFKINIPTNMHIIDIGLLHQSINANGLGVFPFRSLLEAFQIPLKGVGNTGNNAMYALECFINLCERSIQVRGFNSVNDQNYLNGESSNSNDSSGSNINNSNQKHPIKRVSFMDNGNNFDKIKMRPPTTTMTSYPFPLQYPTSPMMTMPISPPPVIDLRSNIMTSINHNGNINKRQSLRPSMKKSNTYNGHGLI